MSSAGETLSNYSAAGFMVKEGREEHWKTEPNTWTRQQTRTDERTSKPAAASSKTVDAVARMPASVDFRLLLRGSWVPPIAGEGAPLGGDCAHKRVVVWHSRKCAVESGWASVTARARSQRDRRASTLAAIPFQAWTMLSTRASQERRCQRRTKVQSDHTAGISVTRCYRRGRLRAKEANQN